MRQADGWTIEDRWWTKRESWECYELRSLRQSPNKDGRLKVDSFQPWVSEMKSNWARTGTARGERQRVVDLTGVTGIDKSGEKALAALFKEGAELIATGTYTQYVVHNIKKKKSDRQL